MNWIGDDIRKKQIDTPFDILHYFMDYMNGYDFTFPFSNQTNHVGYLFDYPICISINDEIAHGNPERVSRFEEGDIITIDIGAKYRGMCVDFARTFIYGKDIHKVEQLIEATEAAIFGARFLCEPGKTVGQISSLIQATAFTYKYAVVKNFTGHGIGASLHEDPAIPNLVMGPHFDKVVLQPGMVICLEPMFTTEDTTCSQVIKDSDGWTIKCPSGHFAAHTEWQIEVTENGPVIIAR